MFTPIGECEKLNRLYTYNMFNHQWYLNLIKPPFTPPAIVFAPVWIVLYVTILISLILFTTTGNRQNKLRGYVFFLAQLVLNILWSPLFFIFRSITAASVVIILLDITVFLTIKEFSKASKLAAEILIPYFIWIIYATYLNLGILYLN